VGWMTSYGDYIIFLIVFFVVVTAVYKGYMLYLDRKRNKADPGLKARQQRRQEALAEKRSKAARREAIVRGGGKSAAATKDPPTVEAASLDVGLPASSRSTFSCPHTRAKPNHCGPDAVCWHGR
jgi:flagellar biosynthesis/type III secretory pathway M-ring protein FliF/YscJ